MRIRQTWPMKRLIFACALYVSTFPPPLAHAYVSPSTGDSAVSRVLVPASIPEKNWQKGHRGADLALGLGEEVFAADTGRVVFAGPVAGTPSVSIEHPDGVRTTYTPVFPRVSAGDEVGEGDVIGTLAPPAHGHVGLHWGALTGPDVYINPLSLLDAPTIRLKPAGGPGQRRP